MQGGPGHTGGQQSAGTHGGNQEGTNRLVSSHGLPFQNVLSGHSRRFAPGNDRPFDFNDPASIPNYARQLPQGSQVAVERGLRSDLPFKHYHLPPQSQLVSNASGQQGNTSTSPAIGKYAILLLQEESHDVPSTLTQGAYRLKVFWHEISLTEASARTNGVSPTLCHRQLDRRCYIWHPRGPLVNPHWEDTQDVYALSRSLIDLEYKDLFDHNEQGLLQTVFEIDMRDSLRREVIASISENNHRQIITAQALHQVQNARHYVINAHAENPGPASNVDVASGRDERQPRLTQEHTNGRDETDDVPDDIPLWIAMSHGQRSSGNAQPETRTTDLPIRTRPGVATAPFIDSSLADARRDDTTPNNNNNHVPIEASQDAEAEVGGRQDPNSVVGVTPGADQAANPEVQGPASYKRALSKFTEKEQDIILFLGLNGLINPEIARSLSRHKFASIKQAPRLEVKIPPEIQTFRVSIPNLTENETNELAEGLAGQAVAEQWYMMVRSASLRREKCKAAYMKQLSPSGSRVPVSTQSRFGEDLLGLQQRNELPEILRDYDLELPDVKRLERFLLRQLRRLQA